MSMRRHRLCYGLPLSVDYRISFEDAVASGKYSYINPAFNDAVFPNEALFRGELVVDLVSFGRFGIVEQFPRTAEVIRDMSNAGLRLASVRETLAFGACYPGLQRKFPIVSLGAELAHQEGTAALTLRFRGGGRSLEFTKTSGVWYWFYYFLGIRKTQ